MTLRGKTDQQKNKKQETQQKQAKNSNYSDLKKKKRNTVIPKMVVVFLFVCLKCCHIFCFVFLNVLFVVVVFVFFFSHSKAQGYNLVKSDQIEQIINLLKWEIMIFLFLKLI